MSIHNEHGRRRFPADGVAVPRNEAEKAALEIHYTHVPDPPKPARAPEVISADRHWQRKAREYEELTRHRTQDEPRGLVYRPHTDGRPGGTIMPRRQAQPVATQPAPAQPAAAVQPAKSTKWRKTLDEKFGKSAVDAELHRLGAFAGEPVNEHNRELVITEEVDHAIVANEVDFPVREIVATTDKSGYCNVDLSSLKLDGRNDLLRLTAFYLAGIVGQEMRHGAKQPALDHQCDEQNAAKFVNVWFHNDDVGKAKCYFEARALARKILTERRDDIERVAAALRERGQLTGDEFRKLVPARPSTPIVQTRTATMPLMIRSTGNAASYGPNDDLQVTWTTGAAVKRVDDSGRPYYEVLELGPNNVRLGRLNSGAPFLNSHDSSSLQSVLGVVVRDSARIENGQRGVASIKLSNRPEVAGVVGDLRDGIVRGISCGYRYHKVERSTENIDDIPVWRVTDWEPLEISATAIQADAGASVRSGHSFECEVRG